MPGPALRDHARDRGIVFLSTPFDDGSADLLDRLDVPAFKVGSGELTNLPFLAGLARRGRPLLVSTGMADMVEVAAAVDAVAAAGDPPLALFHCVSSYPARPEDANLRAIETLRRAFGVPTGWSDHTPGTELALASVVVGASLIEKHLTLDRDMPGPDQRTSLEPDVFAAMVAGIRAVTDALGTGDKVPVEAERAIAAVARRSLHWATSLPAGATIADGDLTSLRPGTGLAPGRRRGRDRPCDDALRDGRRDGPGRRRRGPLMDGRDAGTPPDRGPDHGPPGLGDPPQHLRGDPGPPGPRAPTCGPAARTCPDGTATRSTSVRADGFDARRRVRLAGRLRDDPPADRQAAAALDAVGAAAAAHAGRRARPRGRSPRDGRRRARGDGRPRADRPPARRRADPRRLRRRPAPRHHQAQPPPPREQRGARPPGHRARRGPVVRPRRRRARARRRVPHGPAGPRRARGAASAWS